jgi:hypothetical protein
MDRIHNRTLAVDFSTKFLKYELKVKSNDSLYL